MTGRRSHGRLSALNGVVHQGTLAWLEEYTAIPYPFGKFDFVAILSFQFGGMEHPGAILYNAASLLLEESATQNQVLGRANVIAHETSHMWFGDLVTMRWFDDVWMKEVLASFMAAKIINPSFPEVDHDLRFLLSNYPAAYQVDRAAGTNPIRQPLANLDEAGQLYGAIIYQKAPIAMRQLEMIAGETAFRDGLREYLDTYRFGNAAWVDLVRVLDTRTPEDLSAWSRAWVEERGRPEFTTRRMRANHSTLKFNWAEPPFDDQKVRQAVCYALPYDLILDSVYAGRARRSHSPICSTSEFHTAEFDPYVYDLERARGLMRESGQPDGFDTELWVKGSYECLRLAHIVRNSLAAIGIGVEVRLDTRVPFGTKVPMWIKEECSHALYEPMYDVAHDYDPPLGMWGGKINVDREWSTRIRAIHSADSAEQPRIYREIQRDLMEFAACAHIAEIETGWVFRADVDPWALDPSFLGAATTVWSAHRPILGLRELDDEYEW